MWLREVIDLIQKAGLLKVALNVSLFSHDLICDFLVNLHKNLNEPSSLEFKKVYVKGHCFVFPLSVINQFLEMEDSIFASEHSPTTKELVIEFNGGVHKCWPKNGQLVAVDLNVKYVSIKLF